MTALNKYARLEATGLWRSDPEAQRREVVVSIGEATLVIADMNDNPLTHWSLAAVARVNPGKLPAIFHPDGDPDETLELAEDEDQMIEAIEKLCRAIERSRPHPGRLRWLGVAASVAAVVALFTLWLPGAMQENTMRVLPKVKQAELGQALLDRVQRVSGLACAEPEGQRALMALGARLGVDKLAVLPGLTRPSLHLPGGFILLNRSVIEDYEEPDVAAGFILTEIARRSEQDPLRAMLQTIGLRENFRLLTTGAVSAAALDRYGEHIVTHPAPDPKTEPLLALFEKTALRSTPYARARDITGETTLALIEGDPMNGRVTEPLLSDADWVRLQGICGG